MNVVLKKMQELQKDYTSTKFDHTVLLAERDSYLLTNQNLVKELGK